MAILRSVKPLLRAARRRLGGLLERPPQPHRPALGDAAFVAALRPSSGNLRSAQALLAAGNDGAARRLVVAHFRERDSPRFFCDPGAAACLAQAMRRERPHWLEATRQRVAEDLDAGLAILSMRGKPLARGFEWTDLPRGPGDDDLFSVQPHRFGFLPRLALAAHFDARMPAVIDALLERWCAAAESGERMCYLSPLVVLYRVLALGWMFAFVVDLGGDDGTRDDLLFRVLKILHADASYLAATIGHAYPNNHLLADGFAGWYCGTLYPEFPGADALREKGEAIFLAELRRQFCEDGAGFEHSLHYHELGCEMAAAYVLLDRRNGREAPPDIVGKLKRMLAFHAALSGPECVAPALGNAIEDPLFPLDACHGYAAGAMRELYRALYDPEIAPAPAGDLTVERAYWLLGGALADPAASRGGALPARFEQGGCYVMEDTGARLVFRSGPGEGAPLCAGHAHADILSVYLSVNGVPFIVDAGTYTYRAKSGRWPRESPAWRRYFAGPASHNGLAGSDPYGELKGNFRKRDVPCRVNVRRNVDASGVTWLEFAVTGANAMSGWRRGVVHVQGRYWVVYDIAPDTILSGACLGLQFAPRIAVQVSGRTCDAQAAAPGGCRVSLSAGFAQPRVLTGSLEPLAGWVSPRYGELVAAPQLRAVPTGEAPCGLLLQAGSRGGDACVIADTAAGAGWLAFRVECGPYVELLFVSTGRGAAAMSGWNVRCTAPLAWMRLARGAVVECRTPDGGVVWGNSIQG